MAVTRLERKGQRNKARSRVRKQMMKVQGARVQVASPYKEESGVILEDFDMDHFVKTGEVKIDSADQKTESSANEVVENQASAEETTAVKTPEETTEDTENTEKEE